jgi:hypothetical protein
VRVFGKKAKEGLKSLGEFLYEVISIFKPGSFAELDRAIFEMNNPFRLKDYEFLLSVIYKDKGEYADREVCSILEGLRKKAGIPGNIILSGNESLEDIIRRLVPRISKEKVEYIRVLREAASGKLDVDKYHIRCMRRDVGPGATFIGFSETSADGIEHVIYDLNRGIGVEDIDFKKVLRYKGVHDSETENTYCKLYEPKEEKECKNPQRKCKNCSVYNGFKGSGIL